MTLCPLPHMMKAKSALADMTVENTKTAPLREVGKPFTVRHHRQWDAHVKQIAGGMPLVQPVWSF
ncbi:hypothetical protein [Streptomyces sp. NPDC055036]